MAADQQQEPQQQFQPFTVSLGIAVGVALLFFAIILALNTLSAANPIGPLEYSETQLLAITSLQGLIEAGLAITSALIGLFGAAVLGFHDKLQLRPVEAVCAAVALLFCVLSSLAGTYAKIKVVAMIGDADLYILDPVIMWPLSLQLYSAIAALACVAGLIAYRSLTALIPPPPPQEAKPQ